MLPNEFQGGLTAGVLTLHFTAQCDGNSSFLITPARRCRPAARPDSATRSRGGASCVPLGASRPSNMLVHLRDGAARIIRRAASLVLLDGCLTSQQHAGVSQGRICSDNCTFYHAETEAADQIRSQCTDTGPTSPR